MTIEALFDDNNNHKFSYLLLAKESIDHATYELLHEELSKKINVVPLRASKYSDEDLRKAVELADYVVTGIGKVLDICVELEQPALCDVASNKLDKTYPTFIDFYDPFRNEETKPFYQPKDLELLIEEIYKQLDRHKIDYVNFM